MTSLLNAPRQVMPVFEFLARYKCIRSQPCFNCRRSSRSCCLQKKELELQAASIAAETRTGSGEGSAHTYISTFLTCSTTSHPFPSHLCCRPNFRPNQRLFASSSHPQLGPFLLPKVQVCVPRLPNPGPAHPLHPLHHARPQGLENAGQRGC